MIRHPGGIGFACVQATSRAHQLEPVVALAPTALSLHGLSDVLPAQIHITLPLSWRHRRFRVPRDVTLHHQAVDAAAKFAQAGQLSSGRPAEAANNRPPRLGAW